MESRQQEWSGRMRTEIRNYRSGQQIISERISNSVIKSINEIDYSLGKHDIRSFNKELLNRLYACGWSDSVPLSVYSKISITSVFDKIGLCIQTGNVARTYADLLKLQTLYTDEKINAGILVLPVKECADSFGTNVANYERLLRELSFVFSKVITVPLMIVGFSNI